MYIPLQYQENRQELIFEIIQKNSFATLISSSPEGPIISHLPMLLDKSNKKLISHCARANPHWKYFANSNSVTVLFNGPHAYISPSWYKESPSNVPTWNYIAVHVRGLVNILEDKNETWLAMNKLVQYYESLYGTGWSLPIEPNEILKNDLSRGIVVFEVSMDYIEAKFKLSQKQNLPDRSSVIKGLPSVAGESGRALAEYMKRVLE